MNAKTDDPLKVRSLHIGQRQIQRIQYAFHFHSIHLTPLSPRKKSLKAGCRDGSTHA